jgi:hypothetical protein
MGVIFQNGFGLGTTPNNVVGNIWDPQYKGGALSIYPNVLTDLTNPGYGGIPIYNSSISDAYAPGTYAALAKTAIHTGDKYMITFGLDYDAESSEPNYWLGFGSRSVNLYDYLGSNDNSVGIANTGDLNFGGTTIYTGLTSFGTVGDIIDLAIDGNNKMWIRVNGGFWNGSPIHNPALGLNGIDISNLFGGATLYPAIALFGGSGPSVFSVYETSPYGLPSGFTQIAGDRPGGLSFTLTSSSFDQNAGANSVCGTNQGVLINYTGITITDRGDSSCGISASLSGSSLSEVTNLWTSAGIINQGAGYMFNVTWGPGSTIQNGVVKVGFYTGYDNIRICPIDQSDVDYLLTDGNANNTVSLNGTFNFPATFTLITPQINKGGWC